MEQLTTVRVWVYDGKGQRLLGFDVSWMVEDSCVPRDRALALMIQDSLDGDGFGTETVAFKP